MKNHKSHVDPVCGMRVEKTNAAGEYEHEEVMYYFDSEECMRLSIKTRSGMPTSPAMKILAKLDRQIR